MSDLTENRMHMIFYGHCLSNPNLSSTFKFKHNQVQYTNGHDDNPDLMFCNKLYTNHWYDDISTYVNDVFVSLNEASRNHTSYITINEVIFIVKETEVWVMFYFNYEWQIKNWDELTHNEIGADMAAKIKDKLIAFYDANYETIKRYIHYSEPLGIEEIYL